jgi:hypothetical protein
MAFSSLWLGENYSEFVKNRINLSTQGRIVVFNFLGRSLRTMMRIKIQQIWRNFKSGKGKIAKHMVTY